MCILCVDCFETEACDKKNPFNCRMNAVVNQKPSCTMNKFDCSTFLKLLLLLLVLSRINKFLCISMNIESQIDANKRSPHQKNKCSYPNILTMPIIFF